MLEKESVVLVEDIPGRGLFRKLYHFTNFTETDLKVEIIFVGKLVSGQKTIRERLLSERDEGRNRMFAN